MPDPISDGIDAAITASEAESAEPAKTEEPTTPAPDAEGKTDEAAQSAAQEGLAENFISHLQDRGVEGNRLDQARRYFEDSKRLKQTNEILRQAQERDTLKDYATQEADRYSNGKELLEQLGPAEFLKLVSQYQTGETSDDVSSPDTSNMSAAQIKALEKRLEKAEKATQDLQNKIFEDEMGKAIGKSMDDLQGLSGVQRDWLHNYVMERFYLMQPDQEIGDFVKSCHATMMDLLTPHQEMAAKQAKVPQSGKPAIPTEPVSKTDEGAADEPKSMDFDKIMDDGIRKAIDSAVGTGAS